MNKAKYALLISLAAFALMWYLTCNPIAISTHVALQRLQIPDDFYMAAESARSALLVIFAISPIPIICGWFIVTGLLTGRYVPKGGKERAKFVLIFMFMLALVVMVSAAAFLLHTDSVYCSGCETGSCLGLSFFKWAKFMGIGLLAGFSTIAARIVVAKHR